MNLKARLFDWLASPELLPARDAVRAVRGAASGAAVRARMAVSGDTIPGLLSIVVPVYNVEHYLAQCLDSLLRQNYRRVQIIVVDDGSPDASYEVARRFARLDPRVQIVRQSNGGLSAARNAGIRHARGEFLAFLDSDDFVDRHVYAEAIAGLVESGSDFAVLPYRREKNGAFPPAAPWIGAAHRVQRMATTLRVFPDIMVNAVAWSKVYRRDFWLRHGFEFPVGMLYEDQAVSMAAFAAADAFDVHTHVGINWRMRADQSSITQQVTTPRNIEHHRIAVRDSLSALSEHGEQAAREQRVLQIVNNNLGEFLPNLRQMDDDAQREFREFLQLLSDEMTEAMWREVEVRKKIIMGLVVRNERELALRFLEEGGWHRDHFGGSVAGSEIVAELPLLDDLQAHLPEVAFVFSTAETKLDCVLRRVRSSAAGLEVDLFAHVNHMRIDVETSELAVDLVAPTGQTTGLSVHRRENHADALGHTRRYADMSKGAATATVPLELLDRDGVYTLRASLVAGGLRREGEVLIDGVSEFRQPELLPGGRTFACEGTPGESVAIAVRRPKARITEAVLHGRRAELILQSESALSEAWLVRVDDRLEIRRATAHIIDAGEGAKRLALTLPQLSGDESGPVEYELRVSAPDGTVLFPEALDPRVEQSDAQVHLATRLHTTPAEYLDLRKLLTSGKHDYALRPHRESGRVLLVDLAGAALVSDVVFSEEEILLTVATPGSSEALAAVSARSGSTDYEAVVIPSPRGVASEFEVRIPLRQLRWGLGPFGLQEGLYRLQGAFSTGRRCRFYLSNEVTARFPLRAALPSCHIAVQRSPRNLLRFEVSPAFKADEVGVGDRLRLRDWSARLTPADTPRSVLFRNLYGEAANDSALAVHRELQRRNADIDLIWAVKDASVPVPDGARTVLEGSREFYEAFGTANYVMVNVHQPLWYRKPEGQVLIETFHGYPFKLAGRRWWQKRGVEAEHVETYFRRAEEWDYLVSPARYATQFLAEFFRDNGQIESRLLEIGYPRNDVLLSDEAETIRSDTRRRLGIAEGTKVILYAPTFRDYLSADDMTAEMVDHLDIAGLQSELGSEYLLLLRGHPFNARTGTDAAQRSLNVTDYPDINHLILASDMAVLDYSSLRFDYALTGKPVFFFVPDRERYFEGRESFASYDETSPGPHLSSQRELVAGIREAESVAARFEPARQEFIANYMELEDGSAAARLVDAVFEGDAKRGGSWQI